MLIGIVSNIHDALQPLTRALSLLRERGVDRHFHAGIVVGRDGRIPWDGAQPIRLAEPDRYLILVPAVLDGWCAMFETTQSQLTTIRCA